MHAMLCSAYASFCTCGSDRCGTEKGAHALLRACCPCRTNCSPTWRCGPLLTLALLHTCSSNLGESVMQQQFQQEAVVYCAVAKLLWTQHISPGGGVSSMSYLCTFALLTQCQFLMHSFCLLLLLLALAAMWGQVTKRLYKALLRWGQLLDLAHFAIVNCWTVCGFDGGWALLFASAVLLMAEAFIALVKAGLQPEALA